jgi:membrane protein DedA with SNARE-associated domain
MAIGASIVGDNIGYAIGRWGGHRFVRRVSRWLGDENKFQRVEDWTRRWGGAGIFLTRWLLTPLGPLVNLTSGVTKYSWPRFLLFDAAGEVLWVLLYVTLGKVFSNRVQATSEVLGDFTWVLVGLFIAVVLGWKLTKYLRAPVSSQAEE